jgi:tetratricopeptide (TPR) repeat protein
MGITYGESGEYKRAIECYEKAIAIKPDYYEAWNNMGNVYNKLGEYEKAFFSYTQSIKYSPSYEVIYFSNFPKLIDIASSVFTASTELQRLLDKSSTIAVKIESLSRLLLMGKFTAVNDSFDEILTADNLPLDETKMLDFFLEGYIIEMLKKGQEYGELKVLFKCWIRLNERMLKDEPLKLRKKYLEFFYFYLKTAGKEHVSLNVIHSIMDELKREGVEISDIVVTIIKAVKEPDTREAQRWMADPLFKEIVTMLS